MRPRYCVHRRRGHAHESHRRCALLAELASRNAACTSSALLPLAVDDDQPTARRRIFSFLRLCQHRRLGVRHRGPSFRMALACSACALGRCFLLRIRSPVATRITAFCCWSRVGPASREKTHAFAVFHRRGPLLRCRRLQSGRNDSGGYLRRGRLLRRDLWLAWMLQLLRDRPAIGGDPLPLERSCAWIMAVAVLAAVFIGYLGPGIRFH